MKRLCFLAPDAAHARQLVADLRANGVEERHIYAVARPEIHAQGVPDAGPEGNDFMPSWRRGLELGGAAGVIAGLAALAFPPARVALGIGFVVLTGLWAAGMGGLLSGIAGASYPNSRLRSFEAALEEGKVLVMADVPRDQVEHFEALVRGHEPDVTVEGFEPKAKLLH